MNIDPNNRLLPANGVWFRQPPRNTPAWQEIYDNVSGQMNGRHPVYERGRGMVLVDDGTWPGEVQGPPYPYPRPTDNEE